MRDLELRGAGNLLGRQQSGFIAGVGFELYCNLLRQSIRHLNGDSIAVNVRASLRLDFINIGEGAATETEVSLPAKANATDACIPVDYLKEPLLRIDFYRRLALADSTTAVDTIANTLKDRFGSFPKSLKNLISVTHLRCLAEKKHILMVQTDGCYLKLLRASGKKDDYVKIDNLFSRLQSSTPFKKLQEINRFLKKLSV